MKTQGTKFPKGKQCPQEARNFKTISPLFSYGSNDSNGFLTTFVEEPCSLR